MPVQIDSDEPIFTRQTVCERCAYALRYTGIDVKYYSFGIDDGGYSYIECPREECKHRVRVPSWKLPQKFKER